MEFLETMNSVDGDIKFTSEINWDENKVVFLDLTITIDENGYLQTDLYSKPNAKNGLLLPSSAHKPSVTKSSVYSLALRIIRICSQEEDKDKRLEELAAKLRLREYSEAVIEAGIARAKVVDRADALKRVEKQQGEEGGRQHRLITEYDRRSSPALGGILDSNYHQMVSRDQRLGRMFPKPPRPTHTRGKNLQNLLCRARLPPVRRMNTRAGAEHNRNGVSRCNKGLARTGCVACPFITSRPNEIIKSVTLHSTGEVVPVEGRLNCKSQGGFLYLLWSSKAPAKQYLGSSAREPRVRLGEHRRDIENRRLNKAVAKHFNDTGSTAADLVFVPFKRIKSSDRFVLRHCEAKAINDYNMVEAGVNRIFA